MFGGKSLLMKSFGVPFLLSRELLRPHLNRLRQSRSGNLLVVEVNSWVGLFAHLEYFLEISLHCERHKLTPCFMSTSPQYVDAKQGSNWFEYFFTNLQLSEEDSERIRMGRVPICRIEGIRQLGLPVNYDSHLNLQIAPALIRKYIGIKPQVREKAERFFDVYLGNKSVLGIHYRGTDKEAEASSVPYVDVRRTIDSVLKQNDRFDCLFVSSDEQRFIDFIENEFKHTLPVFFHDDQERSKTKLAVHRSKSGDKYRKGEEAVLNCLLLSKCDALIKTASFLSGWSKLFNPDLPTILMNCPFERQLWFPDREIARANPVPPEDQIPWVATGKAEPTHGNR
jgi:hypothetical protein